MGRWLLVLTLLVARAAHGRAPAPEPCPDVRFVSDVPLTTAAPTREVVTVDAQGLVSIPGFCDPIRARWSRHGWSTVLRARWPRCGTARRVRLRVLYDTPSCSSAKGALAARRGRRIAFAAAPSRCGDDYRDGGTEACELSSPCAAGAHCVDCACVPGPVTTTTLPGGPTTTTLPGLFEQPNPWNMDVSALPVAPESATIIDALGAAGGWGNGNKLQIDFGTHLLRVDAATPFLTFTKSADYTTPDCDEPFPFPMPVGGAIEAQSGYTCDVDAEDCHLLVVDPAAKRLYEAYDATVANGRLRTTCGLTWDLTRSYPPNLRGDRKS